MKFLAFYALAVATLSQALVVHHNGRDASAHHHHARLVSRNNHESRELERVSEIHKRRERRKKRCVERSNFNALNVPPASPSVTTTSATDIPTVVPPVNVVDNPPIVDTPPPVASNPEPAPAPAPEPQPAPAPSVGGEQFFGDATWFNVGLGSCGHVSTDSEFIVAVSAQLYDNFEGATANPNLNPICGRQILATANGRSVTVTVMDRCPECARGSLDLSPAAFLALADLGVGRLKDLSWRFA